jgi:hypothetical protein
VLHALFDTGVVGLSLLGVVAILAAASTALALARPARSWQAGEFALIGLVVACGALVICYQMTDGMWMGFTWFVFGLLVVAARAAISPRTTP